MPPSVVGVIESTEIVGVIEHTEVVGAPYNTIPAGAVGTAQIADGAVTADKLGVSTAYTVTDGDLTIGLT